MEAMIVHTRPLCLSAGPLTEAGAREILERMAQAGKTVWPEDIKLAAKAIGEQRQAVLLGDGSVGYTWERLHAAGYEKAAGKK